VRAGAGGVAAVGTFAARPWPVNQRCLRVLGRILTSGTLVVASLGMWVMFGGVFRALCAAAILVFAVCSVVYVVNGRHRPVVVSGLVVTFLLLSPVEVSIARRPGPPGVVPLEMGLPGPALRERAKRGEVVLGGCIVGASNRAGLLSGDGDALPNPPLQRTWSSLTLGTTPLNASVVGQLPVTSTKRRRFWLLAAIAVAMLGSLTVATKLLFQIWILPTDEMYPTRPAGTRAWAREFAVGSQSIQDVHHGDIVVFDANLGGQTQTFLWRVIALPGETIRSEGADIVVDGKRLDREFVRIDGDFEIFREKVHGRAYEIALSKKPDGPPLFVETKVPSDTLFVLGDNRTSARDSRVLGPIPVKKLKGRLLSR
jgi:signal peptidase I